MYEKYFSKSLFFGLSYCRRIFGGSGSGGGSEQIQAARTGNVSCTKSIAASAQSVGEEHGYCVILRP